MDKLALLGWLPLFQLGAADPRIGSWTLISAQVCLDPPNKTLHHISTRWSARDGLR